MIFSAAIFDFNKCSLNLLVRFLIQTQKEGTIIFNLVESKIPTPKSKSPSSPSTKAASLSSAPSKTTVGESKKIIFMSIDGKQMKCDCTISRVPKPTEKKMTCDCVEIDSESQNSVSTGEQISVKSKKKYRIV